MIRSRRQNFASLPQALSSDSANTHWNLSATMLSCPWSIWDSFRGIQSHTHNWSFGWITIKIHNKIKYLKVPTYEQLLGSRWQPQSGSAQNQPVGTTKAGLPRTRKKSSKEE